MACMAREEQSVSREDVPVRISLPVRTHAASFISVNYKKSIKRFYLNHMASSK